MALLRKLKCKLGRHEFVLEREITRRVSKVNCRFCGKEFAYHNELNNVVPWDRTFEDFYVTFQEIFEHLGLLREGLPIKDKKFKIENK